MFSDKKRQWISGPFFYSIALKGWNDWITSRPDKAYHWKDYKPVFWNIRLNETEEATEIQILYLNPNGPVNILEIRVIIREDDEVNIRAWLTENGI